jgi:hypothetical protein
MCAEKPTLDINASIQKHVAMLKPIFPRRAVISVGNYTTQLLLKSAVLNKRDEDLALFILKLNKNAFNKEFMLFESNIISIDEKADTHYWFNVQQYIAENDSIVEELKRRPIDKLNCAVMVSSTGEGEGSALLPDLTARFKDGNVKTVAFAIQPSDLQPPDAHFNSLWSMATCANKGLTQILIDRDALENYVGVDRKGLVLKGNVFLTYLLDLALSKEQFVQEFWELSKSFNLKMFTVLSATGASLKVYGSIKNILDAALLRPLAVFDLSNASTLYVLVRIPLQLKEKLSRGKIELAVDEWFKEKTSLKSAFVSEPMYVDDGSDRIDIVMFVGGFDLAEKIASVDKKVKEIKTYAVKNGFLKEKNWQELINGLVN